MYAELPCVLIIFSVNHLLEKSAFTVTNVFFSCFVCTEYASLPESHFILIYFLLQLVLMDIFLEHFDEVTSPEVCTA